MKESSTSAANRGKRGNVVWRLLVAAVAAVACPCLALGSDTAAFAVALLEEGDYAHSALEFRRLAAASENDAETAGWYWLAAYSHFLDAAPERATACADRIESLDAPAIDEPLSLLRGDIAYASRKWDESSFYFSSLVRSTTNAAVRSYATEGAAAALLRAGRGAEIPLLVGGAADAGRINAAAERHASARRRSPTLGGLLGLVPGLGHAYSGEYANGLRSLLLNSLFIWAMVETASDDDWALFGVSAFFELTWYSGSIYGGIDAAHRHNRRIEEAAAAEIRSMPPPRPALARVPFVTLEF